MTVGWVRPIRRGWVVHVDVPGPDVDEFAEPDRVIAALARPGAAARSLLAVQHPHRTPHARELGLGLRDALPEARATLSGLLRTAYRPAADVVALYEVDGSDGSACGLLAMVDPAGLGRVRRSEQVYPAVVAERAEVLTRLGCATSAAMLVPVGGAETLTAAVRAAIASAGDAVVSTVDTGGRRHRMWLLGEGAARTELLAVAEANPLLVADGNHRVAAAAAAGLDGLLALLTAGPDLRIGAFHRVLVGTGLDADALAAAWRGVGLAVREIDRADRPAHPGSVTIRCPYRTLVVDLPPPTPDEPTPRIDHGIVENLMLAKALGLDPEGPQVRPLAGDRDPGPDVDAVLLLAPVPLPDVLAVHAAGRRMPRKSTYFTPKPRSGLLLADLR